MDPDTARDLNVIQVCDRFKWTKEYVEQMDAHDLNRMLYMLEGVDAARKHIAERESRR